MGARWAEAVVILFFLRSSIYFELDIDMSSAFDTIDQPSDGAQCSS